MSPATASRVLRNPDAVSEPLRRRVQKAVEKLGYVTNLAASQLAAARTNVIGVIIPSITNSVFSEVLRGIYDAVEATPYQIQLGTTEYSQLREENLVRVFAGQSPAALLVTGTEHTAEAVRLLKGCQCPIVEIMELTAEPIDMQVGFSHEDAAADGTEHLLARGYRRVAFLAAQMDRRSQQRLAGYMRVMQARGLYDPALIVTTTKPSSVSVGSSLCSELFARPVGADAIQANNDDIALGAMFECLRRRVRIPQDFGILGFNDVDTMSASCPSISSILTHRYELGATAMHMLLAAIDHKRPADATVDMPYRLIQRESTGRRADPS